MRYAVALGVAALLLLIAGCGGGDGNTFKNPHGTIHVKKGAEFRVEFTVNSGVGFDWAQIPRLERSILSPAKITVDYPDENRAGQSGTKTFTYTAERTGQETVVFQHVFRGQPRERRTIVVDVAG
jgi:predicted secreted protein